MLHFFWADGTIVRFCRKNCEIVDSRYGPDNCNLWFSLTIVGFIDYIVSPTLTDSLDLILGTLDIPPNFDFLRGLFQIFLSKESPKPPNFPSILNWLYCRYGPECNLWFSLMIVGFIDYIVSPTLTVIGDSLDLILGTLDIPPNARPASVPENRQQPQSHHSSTGSSNSASGNNLLNRPWADILTENRAKWQKKHDAGMLIFNCFFSYVFCSEGWCLGLWSKISTGLRAALTNVLCTLNQTTLLSV